MLSLRGLEALSAFVETGSVSQAAKRMGRTQPQVGRLLSALEREVGFPLFARNSRPLALTREGREFYAQAERVLQGHGALSDFAAQMRLGSRDHVRILTAPFVAQAIIGDAVAAVARRRGGFTAALESRVRLDIDTWVGEEVFDLGVTILPLAHPAFETEEFIRVEAMVAMAPGHPLAERQEIGIRDLAAHDMVAIHPRSILRRRLERLGREAEAAPRIRFEATNGVIACQLAGLGLGCCLSDPFVARSSGVPDLILRRFRPAISLQYGFIYPAWRTRCPAVRELAGEIARLAQEQASLFR